MENKNNFDVTNIVRNGKFVAESEYNDQNGFHCLRFFELNGTTYCIHYENGILLDYSEKKPKRIEPWRIWGNIILS